MNSSLTALYDHSSMLSNVVLPVVESNVLEHFPLLYAVQYHLIESLQRISHQLVMCIILSTNRMFTL